MPTSILTATVDIVTQHVEVFGPNPEWVKVWLALHEQLFSDVNVLDSNPLSYELYEAITKNFIVLAQKICAISTETKE